MRKLATIILGTLLASLCHGQIAKFALFAGPQASGTRYLVSDQKQQSEFKYGFMAGANMKIEFDNQLYFAPSIFYSLKGYKVKFTSFTYPPDTLAIDNNTSIHTIELAPLLQVDLGKDPSHAFIRFGPSLDIQILGKEKFNTSDGKNVSRNMKFSFDGDYGYFGANLLLQFGYETASGIFFFGQYGHGIGSLNNEDGGPRIFHRTFGISIGKYLSGKKIVMDTRNKE